MTPVVIVGGGITGLSAAWELQKAGIAYTLLEAGDRPGGKILTEQVDGYVIEAAADSFLTAKPWALDLARELGLADQLLPINQRPHATSVLHHGKPMPMPAGMSLVAPTQIAPFLRSPLLSPLGKLRVLFDFIVPPRLDDEDESLAQFVRRRFGREAVDKLAAPLMAGIHNANPEQQSILATFARYRDLERQHGSVIRGARAGKQRPSVRPQPAFMTLADGTQTLVDALVAHLSGDLRLNAPVKCIERTADAYLVRLASGEQIAADAVLITTPARVAAKLLRCSAPDAAKRLEALRTVSSGTISLPYPVDAMTHRLDGYGVVIPPSEKRAINAITISSEKFDQRAPKDRVLIRVFFGGARVPNMVQLDDDALLDIVRGELHAILGISTAPLFYRVYRHFDANPQYDVGHLDRIAAIEASLPDGVAVAGSPYHGVGVPDCVHQGQTAARTFIERLATSARQPEIELS